LFSTHLVLSSAAVAAVVLGSYYVVDASPLDMGGHPAIIS
jgi:hypothetical protein